MLALLTVFIAVFLSLLITRVATVALMVTGMSRESARFQARSALSGAGFTTNESESVVNHPVRRRIVMSLMLIGSAGIVTVIGTVVLSFTGAEPSERAGRLGILLAGLVVLFAISRSRTVDRAMTRVIARLIRRYTDLEARDYAELLHLSENYAVMELAIEPGDWIAGQTIEQTRLRDEGIVILGISRAAGGYVGVPQFDTRIEAGDTVLAYGRADQLAELDDRARGSDGDAAHSAAVSAEREVLSEQQRRDAEA